MLKITSNIQNTTRIILTGEIEWCFDFNYFFLIISYGEFSFNKYELDNC